MQALMLVLFATYLCALSAPVNAAEGNPQRPQAPSNSESAALPPPPVIPVDEIGPRAIEVAHLLGTLAAHRVPGKDIESIQDSLPSVSADVSRELKDTRRLLEEQPSLEEIQTQGELWSRRKLRLTEWLNLLTDRATRLQGAVSRLDELQEVWTQTRDVAHAAAVPTRILQQVDRTLAAIQAVQPVNKAERDETLDLQGRVAAEIVRCETVLTEIAQAQQGVVGGVFARDGHPIWNPTLWTRAQIVLPDRASRIVSAARTDIVAYVRDPSKRMPLHLGLFVLVLVALLLSRRQVDEWAAAGRDMSRARVVFDRPFAAALLLTLMAATSLPAVTPFAVKQLFGVLALAPMIVLARPVVNPNLVPVLYTLGVLFALDSLRTSFGGIPPLVDQAIVLLQSLSGGAVLGWFLARGRSHGAAAKDLELSRHMVRRLLVGAILLVLTIGLLASVFGFLRLARLTTPAILVGAVDALWLYAAIEVASGVISFAMRSWPLRRLRMVRNHCNLIESRIYKLLVWTAILAWWFRYLSYLGLWDATLARAGDLLSARIELGSLSTSGGDVLAFLSTFLVAYFLSSLVRFVLAEEVYPRAGIATGISYAASSLFHYVIVALAFLVALGFLGITLTQVTVLAGALGVGIGLGLQGVVNNFVSGLILLFERPINVGDAVQIGDLRGWVRRIGIRASVVRTVQGAEIIVPNAQLTTEQVTNWTLSDQHRRLDLAVGVSYGTAPGQVIRLLEEVARAHPEVLQNPPPQCLFMSYGDSSINFELRVWTKYAIWAQVQSDVTVAVYDAVYAAGMSFPFPQREVRLLSDPPMRPVGAGGDADKRAE